MPSNARLIEISPPGQRAGATLRRWFTSDTLDLIVWMDPEARLQAFQFCYGKPLAEHALEWRQDSGLQHLVVDDGSVGEMGHKRSPMITQANGRGPLRTLLHLLDEVGASLPPEIYGPVRERLEHAGD